MFLATFNRQITLCVVALKNTTFPPSYCNMWKHLVQHIAKKEPSNIKWSPNKIFQITLWLQLNRKATIKLEWNICNISNQQVKHHKATYWNISKSTMPYEKISANPCRFGQPWSTIMYYKKYLVQYGRKKSYTTLQINPCNISNYHATSKTYYYYITNCLPQHH
jgi:hypothetical protein